MISPSALIAGEPDEPPMVSVDAATSRMVAAGMRSFAASKRGATSNGSAPVARCHSPPKVVA